MGLFSTLGSQSTISFPIINISSMQYAIFLSETQIKLHTDYNFYNFIVLESRSTQVALTHQNETSLKWEGAH